MPDLESSEQLNNSFTASLNKTKFHIFKNTSKFSINGLRQFKHNNTCELCDTIKDKDKREYF